MSHHCLVFLICFAILLARGSHGCNLKIAKKRPVRSNTTAAESFRRSLASVPRLQYLGGPVVTTPVLNLYIVFYGQWSGTQKATVRGFLNSLTNSNTTPQGPGVNTVAGWWNLVTKYYDSKKRYVPNKVVIKKEVSNPTSSFGRALVVPPDGSTASDDIFKMVEYYIAHKQFPLDPAAGVYMVLTDPGVRVGDKVNGFCGTSDSAPCGWHRQDVYANTDTYLNYGHAGNGATQCDGCIDMGDTATDTLPSGDMGVDGMLSILAHEIAEAVTDPDTTSGWAVAKTGDENGDICADFHSGVKIVNRGKNTFAYNLVGQGGLKYYIQNMYDIRDHTCKINDVNKTAAGGGVVSSPAVGISLPPMFPGSPDLTCFKEDDIPCDMGCDPDDKDGCVCLKGFCVPLCVWGGDGKNCTNCPSGKCVCSTGKCVNH